ncbi:MAG: hypothetical protein JWN72_879 [Thermoleophilia bacterium]|nr:hypothetical protein [Thermoleophilia bacterium]
MHEDPPTGPAPDDAAEAHARQLGDLQRLAAANEEATWGDTERGRIRVPGILSGDVGPKGKVAAQLRSLSRSERAHLGEVPYGTNVPGSGRLVLLPMLAIALVLALVVALIFWLAA